jgi:hypothetical protein
MQQEEVLGFFPLVELEEWVRWVGATKEIWFHHHNKKKRLRRETIIVDKTHWQRPQANTDRRSLSLSFPQDLSQLHCGNEQQKERENGIPSTTALQKTAPTSLQSRGSDYKPARCNSSNALLQTGPAAIAQLEKLVLQSAEPYTCFT